ncbi:MAG: hypothetical protein Fur007_09140 [Rhodoferax sp.]
MEAFVAKLRGSFTLLEAHMLHRTLGPLARRVRIGLLGALLALAWASAVQAAPGSTNAAAQQRAKKVAPVKIHKSVSAKARTKQRTRSVAKAAAATAVAAAPSVGQQAGLNLVSDALKLKSNAALVVDQETQEVLVSKNDMAVLPIASLTKLMTGLIVAEAKLPMDEPLTITQDDVDTEKHSSSRLRVGTTLSRGELLHLALMSSENRAAHALGRTFPGGLTLFVQRMNDKARELGMQDTRYVEPTGLSSQNQSSARDLAKLVDAASHKPLLREFSTSPSAVVDVGRRSLQFNNTNRLVKNASWDIGVQKTGYISEAGHCLVMQASVAGRKLIMVFLDSAGSLTRIADAKRVRRWVESLASVSSLSEPVAPDDAPSAPPASTHARALAG